ncbi:MAG: hypothetical protein HOQ05_01520 [Corynebacteriales bacterium]|nr:hypothetical protein [Mycobacteriales bacterium]
MTRSRSLKTRWALPFSALSLALVVGLSGCGDQKELLARPVPRNMCDTVGAALLNKLAPGGPAYDSVGDITDDRKTIACELETSEPDPERNREPVYLMFEVSRFGGSEDHKPYENADEWLERLESKAEKKTPKQAKVSFDELDGYTGFVWAADFGPDKRPELEYAVRKDDTILHITYKPVSGIPAATAEKWILDAGEQVLARFNDVQYGL